MMVAYPGNPQSILLELDLKLQNDFLKSRTGTKTSGKEEHDIGIRFFTSVRLELEMQREEDFFFGHL